ncbi:MAG: TPM domain-containing protein [Methylomonas sp.]
MANNPTAAGLRRLLPALLLLGWFFAAGTARAWAQPPMLERRVTDLTDTLSAGQQAVLEARLAEFERQKGSQIAVLLVRTTQPEDIAQFSIRVVEQWKLGRKGVDDGILILVAKDDHKARIEVGYGLEGVVPDAVAKRVIEEIMLPKFRQGDFAGGLNSGVDSLIGLIQGEPLPAAPAFKPGHFFPLLFLLAVFSGSWFRSLFGALFGNLSSAGLLGGIIWLLGGGLTWALFGFFFLFIFNMLSGQNHRGGGGYTIGGGGSGGGFSGGGGGFGGGGASGGW